MHSTHLGSQINTFLTPSWIHIKWILLRSTLEKHLCKLLLMSTNYKCFHREKKKYFFSIFWAQNNALFRAICMSPLKPQLKGKWISQYIFFLFLHKNIQLTFVISKSKGLWNISWYPYLDISDLQNWGKNDSHISQMNIKNIVEKRRRSNFSSSPQYFVTCC